MKIIEFFGLPMSGKSYFVNLIFNHRKKNNFSNYRNIIVDFMYKQKKISFFEFVYWRYINLKRDKKFKKRNNYTNLNKKNLISDLKKKISFFLPSYQDFLKKFDNYFKNYSGDNNRLIDFVINLSNKYQIDISEVLYWIKLDILGFELNKRYSNKILVNSEGFFQRCLSILFRLQNINNDEIQKLINLCPTIDIVYVILNRNISKKKLIQYIRIKNNNFKFNREFIKNFFFIIKCLKKKKIKVKIIYNYKKNNKEIVNDILKDF